ncbi:hypothetical protein D3C78_1404050 [compost metagenome]
MGKARGVYAELATTVSRSGNSMASESRVSATIWWKRIFTPSTTTSSLSCTGWVTRSGAEAFNCGSSKVLSLLERPASGPFAGR